MKRILLIIDDEYEICRLLEKTLCTAFDEIYLATSKAAADPMVRSHPITHIIVDLYLGKNEPLGYKIVQEYRAIAPSIRYAALFTASTVDLNPHYESIDDIFQKPNGLVELVNLLKKETER